MKKNVIILGSCITRDAFNFSNDQYEIPHYFARTSLISLMSKSLLIDKSKINLTSAFQKKCIVQDLEKSFFQIISESKFDFILIDFIDERFNLLKLNDSFITKSNELVASGLIDEFNFTEIVRNEDLLSTWEKSAKDFFKTLLRYIPAHKVIIHKGAWKTKYINEDGTISEFSNQLQQIEKQNKYLHYYYQFIKENFNEMKVLDMTNEELYCSVDHRWGLSPYHFEDRYYELFLQKLDLIVKEMDSKNLADVFEIVKKNSVVLYENDLFVHKINNVEVDINFEYLSIAYYVKLHNEVLFQQWYGTNRILNYHPAQKGEYEIVIFLRDPVNLDNVKYFQYKIKI